MKYIIKSNYGSEEKLEDMIESAMGEYVGRFSGIQHFKGSGVSGVRYDVILLTYEV